MVAEQDDLQCWAPKRSCEDVCAGQGFLLNLPDFSAEIDDTLSGESCVSGYELAFTQGRIGDCTCFVDEFPELTFDRKPPVCQETACGPVTCGETATCSEGEAEISVSCNWSGWKQTDVNRFVPVLGE